MEASSDQVGSNSDHGSLVDALELDRLRERVGVSVDNAIQRWCPDPLTGHSADVLTGFLLAMREPMSVRRPLIHRILAELDTAHGDVSHAELRSERLLLLLATQHCIRSNADCRLPAGVRLQLMTSWMQIVHPPKRVLELFQRGTNTFESACETAVLDRLPAGQLSWVRSGLPRRALFEVPLSRSVPFIRRVLQSMKGFKPMYVVHANGFRRNRFIMLEVEARRSYFRIAQRMRDEPEIKGLITMSWYHDPDLPRVSPHLAWMNSIIHEGGGFVFRGSRADGQSGTFENSTARQAAAVRGEYQPREGIVLWPRAAMIAWADRQTALDDNAGTAQRVRESLDALSPVDN